jgi:hypothetical protein
MAGRTGSSARGGNGRFTRSLKTAQRDADAAALRTRGWSLQRIANELGFASKGAAHDAIRRAFADIPSGEAEEAKQLDLERIDRLIEQAWAVMERLHVTVSDGRVVGRQTGIERDEDGIERLGMDGKTIPVYEDILDDGPVLSAIDRINRLLERRAKIIGYDAPSRSRVEVITEDAVDAEIARLEAKLGERAADRPGAS